MSYTSTREHLFDEVDRAGTILTAAARNDIEGGEIDLDVDPAVEPDRLSPVLPDDVEREVREGAREIDQRCRETEDVRLRLRVLADRFGLSRTHLDVFLLALLPDLDVSFEDVYATTQDDTGATRPTVGFVASLFGGSATRQSAATALVGPSSPLREHGLLSLTEPVGSSTSHRRRLLTVDPRLVSYLEGHDNLDPALGEAATLVDTTTTVSDLRLDGPVEDRVAALADRDGDDRRIHYFHGPDGAGKERAVEALADGRLLRADLRTLLAADLLDRFRREALLQDCPVHLTNVDEATADPGVVEPGEDEGEGDAGRPTVDDVVEFLAALDADLYLTAEDQWTPATELRDVRYALVSFPKPGFELRKACWEAHEDRLGEDVDPAVLASTFELTQAGIDGALATAEAIAETDPDDGAVLSREAVVEGCKAQSATGLSELAEQIHPDASWEDIVLPGDTERQLREVAAHVKHRGTVYEEWGFEDRFSRGTGVVALFAGPSGTGKTLAAEIIATDAGMDIYKIDLSSVVSKYIGETEENLERIFDAARDSNAILLFDEADAVFGKRAGVSDATDRYANVEVNYLLQRIESYDGVVLLTTNNESHIDDAFMRRIHQTVSFTQPDERAREEIWRIMFPEETPTEGLDYEFLSGLELAGGNIRNVAQTAAVLGAADDGVVEMKHVVEASQRELEKLGGLVDPTEFDEYRHLLRSDGESDETDQPAADDSGTASTPSSPAHQAQSGSTGRQSSGGTAETAPVGDEPTAKEVLSGEAETDTSSSIIREGTAKEALSRASSSGTDQSTTETDDSAGTGSQTESPSQPQASGADVGASPPPEPPEDYPTAEELEATEPETTGGDGTPDDGDTPGPSEAATDDADESSEAATDDDPDESEPFVADSWSEDDESTEDRSGEDREKPEPETDVSVSGTPELVVEEFFDYLKQGDGDGAHSLYHENGFAEEFSPRELAILNQSSLSIDNFTRVADEAGRVVIQFTQTLNGDDKPLEYELRPADGQWRIFDLKQPDPEEVAIES